jgi:hypothetical protein
MDVHSYDESQETLALLKILAIGNKEIEAGQTYPVEDVIRELRGSSKQTVQSSKSGKNRNPLSPDLSGQ